MRVSLRLLLGLNLDVLLLTDAFSGLKYWPTISETVGLRVPNRNFRDFSLFSVDFKSRNFSFRSMRFGGRCHRQ